MQDSIGPYKIQNELGRGGMGVVYRAIDERLDRVVAIKALPAELASDPVRLERFEREAKTMASLNHPNVAGIHGVEELEGSKYLILEFVDGETLADRLDRGPLPIDEAIQIAVQIALGVEAAHEAGIIHRDLKPANIMITEEGVVKVLDFGLARTDEGQSSTGAGFDGATISQDQPNPPPTIEGMILGTAAYMSPEQARGRRVDKRSDIWSFGVLLYEMLVGSNPFRGETATDSIGAVLHKDIDLDLLPRGTPYKLKHVLQRCLERNKAERYRDIGDVRIELARSQDDDGIDLIHTSGRMRTSKVLALLALVVVGAGGWIASKMMTPAAPLPRITKMDIAVGDGLTPLKDSEPKISPDGTMLAYIKGESIHLRRLDSFESRQMSGTEGVENIFWSPDSKWVGYHTRKSIFKVSIKDGIPIQVTKKYLDITGSTGGGWTADDRIMFYALDDAGNGIMQVSARGGDVTPFLLVDPEEVIDFHDVQVIMGTNIVLYIVHGTDQVFEIAAFDGHNKSTIAKFEEEFVSHPAYSPTGHILYSQIMPERNLWAISFDIETLESSGEAFLVEQTAWKGSVSLDGTLAVQRAGDANQGNFVWFKENGEVVPIDNDFEISFAPSLSPDLSRVAYTAGAFPYLDIWSWDFSRGVNSRVTFKEGIVIVTGWSPDNREIAVIYFVPGKPQETMTHFFFIDGSGESRPPIPGGLASFDQSWETVAIISGFESPIEIFAARLDDPTKRSKILSVSSTNNPLSLSPDGTLLAYCSQETGQNEIYCTRFPEGTGKWQVSTQGGTFPSWSGDGKQLYFLSTDKDIAIHAVDVLIEPTIQFGIPKPAFPDLVNLQLRNGGWDVAENGKSVIALQDQELSGTIEDQVHISIIQNWFEAFREP